jgi:hypothetical protein
MSAGTTRHAVNIIVRIPVLFPMTRVARELDVTQLTTGQCVIVLSNGQAILTLNVTSVSAWYKIFCKAAFNLYIDCR